MKAICVKNTLEKNYHSRFDYLKESGLSKYDLTIGKIYEIYEVKQFAPNLLPDKWQVIDDFRKNVHTPLDFFKPIEEYRDEQIEQILK
jgi:hypothetical protein